jgi:SAM-dependent methyltransferase
MVRWLRRHPPAGDAVALVGPVPRPAYMPPGNLREQLAREYVTAGRGIEIGALFNPLFLAKDCKVTYVDRYSTAELQVQAASFEESLRQYPLVPVDVVDNGETLASFSPCSQDFIVANHVIEHAHDPLGVLKRYFELLKPGGILYMCVPDKRLTFDVKRPVTALEHLYRDHEEGPAWSHRDHLREWVELVENTTGPAMEQRVEALVQANDSMIHCHVWTQDTVLEMLLDVKRRLGLSFEVLAVVLNRALVESICVLKKTA